MKILLGILFFSLMGYAASFSIREGSQLSMDDEVSESKYDREAARKARAKYAYYPAYGIIWGAIIGAGVGLIVTVRRL